MEVVPGFQMDDDGRILGPVARAVIAQMEERHSTVRENLTEALRRSIIQGDIADGEPMSVTWLAKELNVSRTPVRYAFRRLADEGLIEVRGQAGMVVKGISEDNVREIYAIRVRLESLATRRAMERMDQSRFDRLGQLLERISHLYAENRISEVIGAMGEFDHFIYRSSGMPRLRDIIIQLEDYLRHFRVLGLSSPERCGHAIQEHQAIYRAMRSRDPALVDAMVSRHLEHSQTYLLRIMSGGRR